MNAARLEAFTDGVVAIIITIMVLEIRVPHGSDLAALQADLPVLSAYVLSYVNVGIFWNNHHHMLHVSERVNGKVLWANLALLFWLSLVPFVIRWIDDTTAATRAWRWPSGVTSRASCPSSCTSPPSCWRSCDRGWPSRCMWRWRCCGSCRTRASSRW